MCQNQNCVKFLSNLSIRNMDFLGSEFQLKYTSNGRYQTKVGGVISCLVLVFMGAVMYSSLSQLNSTDSPATSHSTVFSESVPKFDLMEERILFTFGLRNGIRIYNNNNELNELNRFFTIKGFILQDELNRATNLMEAKYILDLDYKPCRLIKDKTILEDIPWTTQARASLEVLGLCPDLEGAQGRYMVKSKPSEPPFFSLLIYIFPCSLQDASGCATLSEFDQVELLHNKIRKPIDSSNFENPIKTVLDFDGTQKIDPRMSKILSYKIKDNEVWDDSYDFFDKKLKRRSADFFMEDRDFRTRNSSQLHCDASTLDMPYQTGCQPYLTIRLASSAEKYVVVRTYSKFFMTLGEIGGTGEIVILFSALIYSGYSWFFLSKYIKNEVFEVEPMVDFLQQLTKDGFQNRIKAKSSQRNQQNRQKIDVIENPDKQNVIEDDLFFQSTRIVTEPSPPAFHRKSFSRSKNSSKNSLSQPWSNLIAKEAKNLLKQQMNQHFSAISLFKRLNELKVLSNIFFKPRHKKLLPIVLLSETAKENKSMITKHLKHRDNREIHRKRLFYRDREHQKRNQREKESLKDMNSAFLEVTRNHSKDRMEALVDSFFSESISNYLNRKKLNGEVLETYPSQRSSEEGSPGLDHNEISVYEHHRDKPEQGLGQARGSTTLMLSERNLGQNKPQSRKFWESRLRSNFRPKRVKRRRKSSKNKRGRFLQERMVASRMMSVSNKKEATKSVLKFGPENSFKLID